VSNANCLLSTLHDIGCAARGQTNPGASGLRALVEECSAESSVRASGPGHVDLDVAGDVPNHIDSAKEVGDFARVVEYGAPPGKMIEVRNHVARDVFNPRISRMRLRSARSLASGLAG